MTEPNEKVSLDSDGISICSRSLCDNGLYARMADLMNKAGMSQRQAAAQIAEELDGKFTAEQVRNKFKYLERKINPPKKVGEINPLDKPSAPKKTSPASPASVSAQAVVNDDQDNAPDGLPVMDQEPQESQESKRHQEPTSEDAPESPVSDLPVDPGQTTSEQLAFSASRRSQEAEQENTSEPLSDGSGEKNIFTSTEPEPETVPEPESTEPEPTQEKQKMTPERQAEIFVERITKALKQTHDNAVVPLIKADPVNLMKTVSIMNNLLPDSRAPHIRVLAEAIRVVGGYDPTMSITMSDIAALQTWIMKNLNQE